MLGIKQLKSLGKASVDRKNYDSAKEYFLEAGDAGAFFELGAMYSNMIPPDYVNAKKYYEKSAEMGNFRALHNIGVMYQLGSGILRDATKAFSYFKKALAIEKNNGQLLLNMGHSYLLGQGVPVNLKTALQYYMKAAENSCESEAFYLISIIYLFGPNEINGREGMDYAKRSADAGNVRALNLLGYLYDRGDHVSPNQAQSLEYYRKAADKNHTGAISFIKRMFYSETNNFPFLIAYHAGFVVPNDDGIQKTFNELAHYQSDIFISFLEKNPDDTFDKLQKKLSTTSFQKICNTIKNTAVIKFIAINHLALHFPDLSSLILNYLIESAYLENIQELAKSPEKLNMPANLHSKLQRILVEDQVLDSSVRRLQKTTTPQPADVKNNIFFTFFSLKKKIPPLKQFRDEAKSITRENLLQIVDHIKMTSKHTAEEISEKVNMVYRVSEKETDVSYEQILRVSKQLLLISEATTEDLENKARILLQPDLPQYNRRKL